MTCELLLPLAHPLGWAVRKTFSDKGDLGDVRVPAHQHAEEVYQRGEHLRLCAWSPDDVTDYEERLRYFEGDHVFVGGEGVEGEKEEEGQEAEEEEGVEAEEEEGVDAEEEEGVEAEEEEVEEAEEAEVEETEEDEGGEEKEEERKAPVDMEPELSIEVDVDAPPQPPAPRPKPSPKGAGAFPPPKPAPKHALAMGAPPKPPAKGAVRRKPQLAYKYGGKKELVQSASHGTL